MVTEQEKQKLDTTEEEPELKGTLISVSVVGIVILVAWFIVFFIFISR